MDAMELIGKLSANERMDMIMKGFRPGDINDVKKYKRGEQLSLQEKENKAKVLGGEFRNLGSSNEREEIIDTGGRERVPLEEFEKAPSLRKNQQADFRQQLNEEMEDYNSTAGKTFNTDDILSLKKSNQQRPQKQNNLQMIAQEGFKNAKEYLNAFVLNLQNENPPAGYQMRLNIFKALKKCLEVEGNYKGNQQALNAYRQGVVKAEKALLENMVK